jgi:uncharacterized membrane protein
MGVSVVRFVLLVLMALLVGTMFGIWVGFDPAGLSATAYVEQQQNAIRSLNTLLPAMGGACVVLTVALGALTCGDRLGRVLLTVAVALMLVSAGVTRFANQPINATVMTWNPQGPPDGWADLRDEWRRWHAVRTAAAVAALMLTVAAVVRPAAGRPRRADAAGPTFPEGVTRAATA